MSKYIIDFDLKEEDIIEEKNDREENIPQHQIFRKVESAYKKVETIKKSKPVYNSDEYWQEVDKIIDAHDVLWGVPLPVSITLYLYMSTGMIFSILYVAYIFVDKFIFK